MAPLRADNAPLILSFLERAFVEDNARELPAATLIEWLEDDLYALNLQLGEGSYPKTAASYLDDWAAPERGWLRKHYAPGTDEEPTTN